MSTYERIGDNTALKWWNDFGVYLFCLLGTIVTKVIPDFSADPVVIVLPTWQALIVSAVVALIVMAIGESRGDLLGKRKNFKRRAMTAFLLGVFCIEIIQKFEGVI
jgi:hypothetical protein